MKKEFTYLRVSSHVGGRDIGMDPDKVMDLLCENTS